MKTFTSNIKIVTINEDCSINNTDWQLAEKCRRMADEYNSSKGDNLKYKPALKKYLLYAARQLNCTYLVPTNHRIIRMYKHKTAIELHFFDTMMSFNHAK